MSSKFNPFSRKAGDSPFQLEFVGLKVKKGSIHNLFQFIRAFRRYLTKRTSLVGTKLLLLPKFGVGLISLVKSFLRRKLIWSRGRLGRPIANLFILSAAFVAFLTGGVFSGTEFVNSATVSPDYIAKADDIIPEAIVATTALPEGRRTEALSHDVKSGETLSSIGSLYKVTVDALKYVNNLTDEDFLRVGQKLTIPPVQGVIYKVKEGDTCDTIGKKFEVPPQAILDFNYLDSCTRLAVGKELVVPDAKIPVPVFAQPNLGQTYQNYVDPNPKSGWCIWPTTVRIITQYFTYYHNGLDIATPWGSMPPLYACGNGTVTRAGWDPFGLGLHVIIDHGNGFTTVYGHMSKIGVSVGQDVDKGEVIGVMGNTGRSTGPHVHFIIRKNGVPQNPLNYVK